MSKIRSRSAEEVLAEDLKNNPEFRTYWERTTLARAVALAILHYRTEHNLSQRRLGQLLGIHQSHVSRLELGEHTPLLEMLQKLSMVLGLRFILDIGPSSKTSEAPIVFPPGVELVEDIITADGSQVRVATG